MAFTRSPVELAYNELQSHTDENGFRYYTTPDGRRMPSITSVLSGYKKDIIDAWIERVGEEEAEKIRYQAAWRGGEVHESLEAYIDGVDPSQINNLQNPVIAHSFIQIKNIIDKHLTTIYGMELPLYSDVAEVAGRADLIGVWNGDNAIIDFKTSLKSKKAEWIDNYFMQAAFYALAFEELTGIRIKKLVIVMATDDGIPQTFVENTADWIPVVAKYIMKWKEENAQQD